MTDENFFEWLPTETIHHTLSYLKSSPSSLWKFAQTSKTNYQFVTEHQIFKGYQLTRDFSLLLTQQKWSKDKILTVSIDKLNNIINDKNFNPNLPLLYNAHNAEDCEFLLNGGGNAPLIVITYLVNSEYINTEDAVSIIRSLLEKKADPNCQVKRVKVNDSFKDINRCDGFTPLYFVHTELEIVKLLLEYGANPNLKTQKIDSYLDLLIDDFLYFDTLKLEPFIRVAIQHGANLTLSIKEKFIRYYYSINSINSEDNPRNLSVAEWLDEQCELFAPTKNLNCK